MHNYFVISRIIEVKVGIIIRSQSGSGADQSYDLMIWSQLINIPKDRMVPDKPLLVNVGSGKSTIILQPTITKLLL